MAFAPAAALLWALAAPAQSVQPLATRPGWQLGLRGSESRYREPGLGLTLSSRTWAAGASWTLAGGAGRPFLTLEGEAGTGSGRYQGSGTLDGVPERRTDFRIRAGRDFFPSPRLVLAPYLGWGQRDLGSDLRGVTSSGALGYRRESTYRYLPAGCTARVPAGPGQALAATVEYAFLLGGTQVSRLSDAQLGFRDAVNHQAGGHGFRLALTLERGRAAFGPWLRTWDIAASDTVLVGRATAAQEPRNHTRELGVGLDWRF